ncbi:helix-turn-helix domain-containing protein [Actinomadura harenae]|uniref:XRE family transcriptional regulator n=1 Tax=Actinomadura harenae TaxID=2483351 RepID=A0A3M2M4M0_9ACTN|nr:helix-turn-helix transcriptional regulator [Actinomadura harenae]RMI44714.1 XRE family transcriptional regulator [Actinomadura harenae]
MEQIDPATAVVARRVRELREKRGWSAQRLADEMASAGVPWKRIVVTKLENSRRQSVSLAEVLTLAYVLDVAPVHLIIPTEGADPYPITPDRFVRPAVAREWIRGRMALDSQDPRLYFSEVPLKEWTAPELSEEEINMRSRLNRAVKKMRPRLSSEAEQDGQS